MITIDLQKALGIIDHQILLKKMKHLHFFKKVFAWFKSYFCKRRFEISSSTSYSNPSNLLCSVPHRAILGTLWFLLYITDWHKAVSRDSLLYADGNCIVFQRKRVIEIEKQLIRNLSSLFGKFVDNKLSKHFGKNKTKTILFVTTHKL